MRNWQRFLFGLSLSMVALYGYGCGDGVAVGIQVGDRAPDFALSDTEGQRIQLSAFRGQPVVLVFYRTSG